MNNHTCNQIRDMLVDYADGQLPADQAAQVEGHLTDCPACRELVAALHRSLGLAQEHWEAAMHGGDQIKPRAVRLLRKRPWLRVAAVAAVVVAGVGLLLSVLRPQQPQDQVTVEQIRVQVERAASAARLLAATDLLAQCKDVQSIVESEHQYILTTYPDTLAAENLRSRRGL